MVPNLDPFGLLPRQSTGFNGDLFSSGIENSSNNLNISIIDSKRDLHTKGGDSSGLDSSQKEGALRNSEAKTIAKCSTTLAPASFRFVQEENSARGAQSTRDIGSNPKFVDWSKQTIGARLSHLANQNTGPKVGPGSYNPKKKVDPRYKKHLQTSAFASDSNKGVYGSRSVGKKLNESDIVKNLQYLVDMEPGPGSYCDERHFTSFRKKFRKSKKYEDFRVAQPRFKTDNQGTILGPGEYQMKDQWVRASHNRAKIAFNSNAEKLSLFEIIEKQKVPVDDRMLYRMVNKKIREKAALRKKKFLLEKRKARIRDNLEEENRVHAQFRKQLLKERERSPDPGEYFSLQQKPRKKATNASFKSTSRRMGWVPKTTAESSPPPGYYLVTNGTLADKLSKEMKKIKNVSGFSFSSRRPRFATQLSTTDSRGFHDHLMTDDEKMVSVVQQLYKGPDVNGKGRGRSVESGQKDELYARAMLTWGRFGRSKQSYPFNKKVKRMFLGAKK